MTVMLFGRRRETGSTVALTTERTMVRTTCLGTAALTWSGPPRTFAMHNVLNVPPHDFLRRAATPLHDRSDKRMLVMVGLCAQHGHVTTRA
eukprot:CAMPEP_0181188516 /NCGR_PEP_ID=MMETSP1096-20121128/11160_1 /TAXON_ID=156174 ORGANISM="Chrysochromulina ericina, Strain CCMP281" /NCGR_SAMPLE_ID=MMETSP1096 /ASSEMBLY_ACC=CAM_ASM_000453 /LENGTH=90 /DNA_ID=CAMNT_0023277587 /DNA_START=82 /DNA_END=355 /DNA_ORIENTATION=+